MNTVGLRLLLIFGAAAFGAAAAVPAFAQTTSVGDTISQEQPTALSDSPNLADVETVWCAENGTKVITSGANLGLVELPETHSKAPQVVLAAGQSPVAFDDWKLADPATFQRACAAAFGAEHAAVIRFDRSDDTLRDALLGAVAGALFAGGVGWKLQNNDWKKQLKGEAARELFNLISASEAIAGRTGAGPAPAAAIDAAGRAADGLTLALKGLGIEVPEGLAKVRGDWPTAKSSEVEQQCDDIDRAVRAKLGFTQKPDNKEEDGIDRG